MEYAEKQLKIYHEKNLFFEKNDKWQELDTFQFLYLLFRRDIDNKNEDAILTSLPFEERMCESYEWWLENKDKKAKRPAEYNFVYNGICQAIYGKNSRKNKTYVLTNLSHYQMGEILENPFVIMSPISYVGRRRTKANARYLYAIVIDIDEADAKNVANLIYQTNTTRPTLMEGRVVFPQPNIIVNSGNGIHIYYLLETPVPMFDDTYKTLNKIKKELTRRAWNVGTTHLDPKKPQYQGNCQGFRLPGTLTKFNTKVRAWRNLNSYVPPYYKIEDLAKYGKVLNSEESALLEKGQYNPNRRTLKQAKELFPEWYEKRIVKKVARNRWAVKRDLYDWFKEKIYDHAEVGHRYFCCMALSIYARKCNIPEEELDADLKKIAGYLDALSPLEDRDRFFISDAMDAKSAYKDCYCKFPREDISKITGIPIKEGRRNFRDKYEHLRRARMVRDGLFPNGSWRQGSGRKDKSAEIAEWRKNNPNGTKAQCCRELNLTKPTVYKWWETPDEMA